MNAGKGSIIKSWAHGLHISALEHFVKLILPFQDVILPMPYTEP